MAARPSARADAPAPWGPWVEPDFPFFSSVVDGRRLGAGFPADNLTPRGLVLNLGHGHWACFDTELLRIAAIWDGGAVTTAALSQISYQNPAGFNRQDQLPAPAGKVWLANGIYPGWQAGERISLQDPRAPGPSPEEVGRGPLAAAAGRFQAVRLTQNGLVLEYTVGTASIREQITAGEQSGAPVLQRHFWIGAADRPLVLILGPRETEAVTRRRLAVAVKNFGGAAAAAVDNPGVWAVRVAAHPKGIEFCVALSPVEGPVQVTAEPEPAEPLPPAIRRWPQVLSTQATLARGKGAYVVDEIALPLDNPWRRNIRLADVQFFPDGSAAGVTMDGDVWLIDGLKGDLKTVRWRRFASGLHEPISLAIRDRQIFVFDRNGIWRLRDAHGTGEADTYELFCNLFTQTAGTREYPNSLKLAPDGSFIVAKGDLSSTGTKGRDSGSVLRVAPDGKSFTVLGWGFREPFAGINAETGLVTASDQEGEYVPATPIYALERNAYHGYLDSFQKRETYPAAIADPLTWIPHPVIPSAVSQVWLTGARMGPLNGALLLLAYSRPELFRVLLDHRHAQTQAAVVSLTSDFKLAPLNAAISPADGQLYVAGFRIYGTSAERVSGLARVRYTGAPSLLPREVVAMDRGILLRFDVALDEKTAVNPANYVAGRWNYKRTYHYGSGQYQLDGGFGQDRMAPSSAYLSRDGKTVFIGLPEMKTGVWQMHVGWSLKTRSGDPVADDAYFTPFALAQFAPRAEGFGDLIVDLTPRTVAPPPASPVSAEEGRRLSGLLGCVACHTTNGTVGTSHLAPTWKDLYGTTVTLNDGTTRVADGAYIRDHILKRTDKFVKSYENAMPNYSGVVSEAQIQSLILFIQTLAPAPAADAAPPVPLTEGAPKFLGDVVAGEGPSWDPAGYLYFVGKPSRISRLDPDGKVEIVRDPAGGPGGSLVDPQRRLLVCEAGARRVTRTEGDGTITVLADNYEGKRFNSPNDLALDSKGRVYFTDPRYGNRDSMEIRDGTGRWVEGVYRVDAPGEVVRIMTHEVNRPNGILVSPDDRYLYVADNQSNTAGGTSTLLRFDLRPDGTIDPGSRKLIFDWGTSRGADGFKLDRAGRLYVAAGLNTQAFKSGIYILAPEGRLLEFVPIRKPATNCAFGGPDLKTLYITAAGELWSLRTTTPGQISAQ